MARRKMVLGALAGLAGCSVLPDRPYQEVQRFGLAPQPPRAPARASGPRGRVLLLRIVRAAPGLDQRGLRIARPDGRVEVEFWSEWIAPPAELVEAALRQWLAESGLFAAVVPPGSRLSGDVAMEAELVRLEAVPAEGVARAALSVLLLADASRDPAGQVRILGQFQPTGTAPLPAGATPAPSQAAAAMEAALGAAFAVLEEDLRGLLAPRPGLPAGGPSRPRATPAAQLRGGPAGAG
jgi:ABC-type uncharacterized transport system auxiliary subunit